MLSLRLLFPSFLVKQTLPSPPNAFPFRKCCSFLTTLQRNPRNFPSSMSTTIDEIQPPVDNFDILSPRLHQDTAPFLGVEDALMGFIFGKRKATEVAHLVWRNLLCKGDAVVDATCGNGQDTLALLKMVADESGNGCVYGMDIQNSALENTSSLLDVIANPNERKLVKLFPLCHSRMEDVVPEGGDKSIITTSKTTLPALQAASRILGSGGLISILVYVGHPGGRDELETVQAFASGLSVETWVCCKFEMLNRPTGPVLILLSKK
ncbi:S-adenosyl-L-methionine-dependent methyltransferases superfamily protein isoform X2 [Tasmannia lanceolata]|uniref:S-adenosyl-L-methionine-dependent methyltransferases superfamily protein isoform X2 n=1 Tax=Tasmannia lanceolata TaxID=3420 RepID=UPI004063F0FB